MNKTLTVSKIVIGAVVLTVGVAVFILSSIGIAVSSFYSTLFISLPMFFIGFGGMVAGILAIVGNAAALSAMKKAERGAAMRNGYMPTAYGQPGMYGGQYGAQPCPRQYGAPVYPPQAQPYAPYGAPQRPPYGAPVQGQMPPRPMPPYGAPGVRRAAPAQADTPVKQSPFPSAAPSREDGRTQTAKQDVPDSDKE